MFDPETEARFKRIEDVQTVTAELQHRFELRTEEWRRETEERILTIEEWTQEIQSWTRNIQRWMEGTQNWREEAQNSMNALATSLAELSEVVRQFLKSRTNGSQN